MSTTAANMEAFRNGITARLLDNYADSLLERREQGETIIDSDFPFILQRAAKLLRLYCPEVQEKERQRAELLETVKI